MKNQGSTVDISEFLLAGSLGSLIHLESPFASITKALPTESLTEGDGDIPALYIVMHKTLIVEVGVLEGFVVSIAFKLESNPNVRLTFGAFGEVNEKTNFVEFVRYLNQYEVEWQIYEAETRGKTIGILFASGASMLFSFEEDFFQLFRFGALNWDYYNRLAKQMKESKSSSEN